MSPNLKICASSVSGAVASAPAPPFTPQFCLAGQKKNKKQTLGRTALKRGQLEAPAYKRGGLNTDIALSGFHTLMMVFSTGKHCSKCRTLLAVDKGQICLGRFGRLERSWGLGLFGLPAHFNGATPCDVISRGPRASSRRVRRQPSACVRCKEKKKKEKTLSQSKLASATSDAASTGWEFFSLRAP